MISSGIDGQKFLEMMEQLAEQWMQREEEAAANIKDDSEEESDQDPNDESDDNDKDEDEVMVMKTQRKVVSGSLVALLL